jgi:hypothetical protein
MASVLESVPWGKSALSLLSNIQNLDQNKPAILQIRHSEWPLDPKYPNLTKQGKQTAYNFGKKLPPNRTYRIYHTNRKRTQQTASQIHEGLTAKGIKSEINGIIPYPDGYNSENLLHYIRKERELGYDNPVRSCFYSWLGGRYPPDEVIPIKDFGRLVAESVIKNLESAKMDTVDVYVSHENWIAAFMFTWLGMCPEEWVSFLDGFLLQLGEEKMMVYNKEGTREIHYPHWWKI